MWVAIGFLMEINVHAMNLNTGYRMEKLVSAMPQIIGLRKIINASVAVVLL
jgi:hypothetical protein